MRILSLRLENINSLKGRHEIRFDESPLKEAGLFAITGPIGAGKTTLLDVITLALFNKTPRLGKISLAEITENGVIVTRNTDSAFAEVEYESRNKVYRSRWFIGKKRTGGFNDYEMELAEIHQNGEATIIQSKKSAVPDENANIIGLTYEQFERSIVLSQGEFSKFLKSGKNERSKLLEQLTGTGIFRNIGIKAFEKKKEADKQIELKTAELNASDVLNQEEVETLTERLQLVTKQLSRIYKKLEHRERLLRTKQEIDQKKIELSGVENRLTSLVNDKAALQPEIEKLRLHERAIPFQQMVFAKDGLQAKLVQSEEALVRIAGSISQTEKQLLDLFQKVSAIIGIEVNPSNINHETATFRNAVITKRNRINEEIQLRKHTEATLISLRKELKEDYPIQVRKETDKVSFINAVAAERKSQLAALHVPSSVSAENADEEISRLSEKLKLFEALLRENSRYAELQAKKEKAVSSEDSLKETVLKIRAEHAEIAKTLEVKKAEREVIYQQKVLQSRIADLKELRKDLIAGVPCPLCGSASHPWASGHPEPAGDLDIAIKKKEDEIRKSEKAFSELTTELGKCEGELSGISKLMEDMSGEIRVTSEAIQKLDQLLAFGKSASLIDEEISSLERNIKAIQTWVKLNYIISLLEKLSGSYAEHRDQNDKIDQLQKELEKLYPHQDIETNSTEWLKLFSGLESAVTQLKKQEEAEKNGHKETLKQIDEVIKKLNESIKTTGFADEQQLRKAILPAEEAARIRRSFENVEKDTAAAKALKESLDKLIRELLSIDNTRIGISSVVASIENYKRRSAELSEEKGSLQSRLEINAQNSRKVATLKKELKALERDSWKWNMINELIGDAKGNKFCNIVQEITIRQLFAHANTRLQKLTDRYLLIHSDPGKEDIEVIDRYMGNMRRVAKSLSGGETFLVSLALALGLSDLASRNVRLDSLFIDEGFGTLDPETLDVAISTLEKLQAESNKTIGIISHVEALKERIACQVRIIKHSSGFSEVEVV